MRFSFVALLAGFLASSSALAAQRASDILFVPAIAKVAGLDTFETRVVVTNVHTAPATITVQFLKTSDGNGDNRSAPAMIAATALSSGASLVLDDVLRSFGVTNGSGALIVFGCETGKDCQTVDADGVPIGAAPLLAWSRTFSIRGSSTSGQSIPGIPFYDLADPASESRGRQLLTGLVHSPAGGVAPTFRTNVGFLNASSDWTLTLEIVVRSGLGTEEKIDMLQLAPLAHTQRNGLLRAYGLDDGAIHSIAVRATAMELVPGVDPAVAASPSFAIYASTIDDGSGDPTFLEGMAPASFEGSACNAAPRRRPFTHPKAER